MEKNNSMLIKVNFIFCILVIISGCSLFQSTGVPINLPVEPPTAELTDDGWISENNFYEKIVYYGTTRVDTCTYSGRNRCRKKLLRLNSGNSRSETEIKYGIAKVKIPFIKRQGETSGMSLTNLEHNIGWKEFISKLSSDDLLIFVHGFNTSFTNAAIRCAQLSHDTDFKGKAVFYSWPSHESSTAPLPTDYARDQDRAEENIPLLANFLNEIANKTDKKIHIVAHSMGTYILMESLALLHQNIKDEDILKGRRDRENKAVFEQIILAAPDISKESPYLNSFNQSYSGIAKKFTLYSTEKDLVLKASKVINYFINDNGKARLGDSSGEFFVAKGMDTVDARQEIPAQFFGHSFYAKNRSLVTDIHLVLNHEEEPENRMLQRVEDKNKKHLWFIRD